MALVATSGAKRKRISERKAVCAMDTLVTTQSKDDRQEHLAWVWDRIKASSEVLDLVRAVIMKREKATKVPTNLKRGVVSLGTTPVYAIKQVLSKLLPDCDAAVWTNMDDKVLKHVWYFVMDGDERFRLPDK